MTRVIDGKLVGVSGLEATYNALLSGEDGYLYARRNNYSNKGVDAIYYTDQLSRRIESQSRFDSRYGSSDDFAEELLSIATAAGLKSGVHGLVMEVDTGDLLAMAQVGGYDASDPTAMPIGFRMKSGMLYQLRRRLNIFRPISGTTSTSPMF